MWTTRQRQRKRYFAMLGGVVAAYIVYTLLAVPWIEGPRRNPQLVRPPEKFDLYRFKADLVSWLPEDAWERQPCKQISTRTGHLFFRDYQPFEDGRLEVRPLTIILMSSNAKPGDPPLILQAPEGATLQLDQPLSVGGTDVHLVGGSLTGNVTLRRAASPDGRGEFFLQTSHLQLSKERIQTLQPVDFRMGPHYGRGRNLVIEFDADPLQAQQPAISGVRGVRHMELRHIDQLHVQLPTEANRNREIDSSASTPTESTPSDAYPNGFDVVCQGPLEFELDTNTATLSGGVRMTSVDRPTDYLEADHLAFEFLTSPDDKPASPSTDSGSSESSHSWALTRVAAHGQPAVLHLETQSLDVRGDVLAYGLIDRTLELGGNRTVELRHAGLELFARQAKYQLTSDGSLGLGNVWGPAVMRRPATEQQPALSIEWNKLLSLEDDDGQKRMTIDGLTQLQMGTASKLSADQLQLWLWQVQLPSSIAATEADLNRPIVETTQPQSANAKWSVRLDRLVARGAVSIVSDRVAANVDELNAQWPSPQLPAAHAATPSAYAGLAHRGVSRTQSQEALPEPAAPIAEARQPQPITVNASLATVQMLPTNEFREIVFQENVRVEQKTEFGAPEMELTGTRLEIQPQLEQKYRLTIRGSDRQPAIAKTRQFALSAPSVHLDQTANRLWIDSAGQLVAQQRTEPTATEPSPAADMTQPADQPQPVLTTIDLRWSGGMVFNGQQIYLESGIHALCDQQSPAELSHLELHCEAINVSLSNPIDLSGASERPTTEAELELLTLIGQVAEKDRVFTPPTNVEPRSSVTMSRQLTLANRETSSAQTMEVPWGQWNAKTGQLNMSGPGLVCLWQKAAEAPLTGRLVSTEPAASPLTNTSIRFQKSLTGNLNRSELVFSEKVRTIHGPVADWDVALDPDQKNLAADQYWMRSDELQITQWRKNSATESHVEIIALGQAELQGQTFDAFAQRIGYNQSQEKVLLEGDPRSGAKLTYQTAPDGPRNPLVASKIIFNLRDNTTQVEGFKHGVLTTGPILPKR